MEQSQNKRRRYRYEEDSSFRRVDPNQHPDNPPDEADFWTDQSFFAMDSAPIPSSMCDQVEQFTGSSFDPTNTLYENGVGPSISSTEFSNWLFGEGERNDSSLNNLMDQTTDWMANVFPEASIGLPSRATQKATLDLQNPFTDGQLIRHPQIRKSASIPEAGGVNGYIKFRLKTADFESENRPSVNRFCQTTMGVHHRQQPQLPYESVPHHPPDFGKGFKLDPMDSKLWKFYLVAFCGGRTLLPNTNFWLVDYAPMAAVNNCVKHALLSLAAAYVLDYLPSEQLLERTNYHYSKAVQLLTKDLCKPDLQATGKDDSLVCSIVLLIIDDLVNWELRKPKGCRARWQDAVDVAKKILDNADPGYRYWKSDNVQCSGARTSNANWVAFVGVLAQPVSPLKLEDTDRLYAWLLEGTERQSRKIHGGTGLSPKLLHMFAQITHLCARMDKMPNSQIVPHGAAKIEERLISLRQWSERSEGYASGTALLNACDLDEHGKTNDPTKVTELTGETWRVAAQIYLHCRFYRRPRSHPLVKERLNVLLRCVESMPYTGPLFTSQAPFFPIVMMALMSTHEEERSVCRDWFNTIVSGGGCRSSVPPVWEAVKAMWSWMDAELTDEHYDDKTPIGQRSAWWELMVTRLVDEAGVISLV